MNFNGTVASMQTVYHPIVDASAHPPVYRTVEFAGSSGTFGAGEVIAFDASGNAVSYVAGASDSTANIVGVLAEPVDASGTSAVSAKILWHGAVKRAELTVGGSAPAPTDYGAVENTGRIFLV